MLSLRILGINNLKIANLEEETYGVIDLELVDRFNQRKFVSKKAVPAYKVYKPLAARLETVWRCLLQTLTSLQTYFNTFGERLLADGFPRPPTKRRCSFRLELTERMVRALGNYVPARMPGPEIVFDRISFIKAGYKLLPANIVRQTFSQGDIPLLTPMMTEEEEHRSTNPIDGNEEAEGVQPLVASLFRQNVVENNNEFSAQSNEDQPRITKINDNDTNIDLNNLSVDPIPLSLPPTENDVRLVEVRANPQLGFDNENIVPAIVRRGIVPYESSSDDEQDTNDMCPMDFLELQYNVVNVCPHDGQSQPSPVLDK